MHAQLWLHIGTVLPRNNLSKTASDPRHFACVLRLQALASASSLRSLCVYFASVLRLPCVRFASDGASNVRPQLRPMFARE